MHNKNSYSKNGTKNRNISLKRGKVLSLFKLVAKSKPVERGTNQKLIVALYPQTNIHHETVRRIRWAAFFGRSYDPEGLGYSISTYQCGLLLLGTSF